MSEAPESERASLLTLLRGGVVEMFDDELEKVAANILDPNTSETATRVVTIKVSIKPDVNRSMAATAVSVVAKLAPVKPQGTALFFGSQRGKAVVTEHNPDQQRLPGIVPEKPKVVKGGG